MDNKANMEVVSISDMKLLQYTGNLITYSLGSCIGICFYDKMKKLGAMGHIMLPSIKSDPQCVNVNKYADSCIANMIKILEQNGSSKSKLTAKIAGGAQMFKVLGDASAFTNIGARNVVAVKNILQQHNIPIIAEDIGEDYARTMIFDVDTGIVTIKSFNKPLKTL